jgi:inosose dehydratase
VIRVANAPCSWGVLEFEATGITAPASQVLDEMAAAGYAGTELGDWGFLPTEPQALAAEAGRRGLDLVGAFVPVALSRTEAIDEGRERAVLIARLLAGATGGSDAAVLVLSDDNASVPNRTARAGRVRAEDGGALVNSIYRRNRNCLAHCRLQRAG